MKSIKKYFKHIGITILSIAISLLLLSTLYYFNLISTNVVKYLRIIIVIIILFISGYILGKKNDKHGYIEGLKLGGIIIGIIALITLLFFRNSFEIKIVLYYIILLFNTMLGSMIGISNKK